MRLLTVALAVLLMGCPSIQEASPETHVANARAIYTAALNTFADLAEQGHVDLELAEQFEEVRVRVAAMLEEADAAVTAGAEFDFADLASTMESLTTVLSIAMKGLDQ